MSGYVRRSSMSIGSVWRCRASRSATMCGVAVEGLAIPGFRSLDLVACEWRGRDRAQGSSKTVR